VGRLSESFNGSWMCRLKEWRTSTLCVVKVRLGRCGSRRPFLARVSLTKHSYLVDSASSHMLVSKIKPCMSQYKPS
jgi:hypothetical protein